WRRAIWTPEGRPPSAAPSWPGPDSAPCGSGPALPPRCPRTSGRAAPTGWSPCPAFRSRWTGRTDPSEVAALQPSPRHATPEHQDGQAEQGEEGRAGDADDAVDARREAVHAVVPGLGRARLRRRHDDVVVTGCGLAYRDDRGR